MKFVKQLVTGLLFFSTLCAAEGEAVIHSSTTIGSQGRFEIIQSTLAAKWTFRLDRSCGYVAQLIGTANDGITWNQTAVVGLPQCPNDSKIRYQIFTSGLAAKHTFLINNESGVTWQLTGTTKDNGEQVVGWVPFQK